MALTPTQLVLLKQRADTDRAALANEIEQLRTVKDALQNASGAAQAIQQILHTGSSTAVQGGANDLITAMRAVQQAWRDLGWSAT